MIHIRSLIAYLLLIGLAVLYTLFLEAPGGSYLITALVSAAVISLLICFYTSKKLTAEIDINGDILNRGDTASISLVLTNTGILPSAFVTAELFSSYHFVTSSPKKIRTSVTGHAAKRFGAEYKADFFGKGKIGISSISVTDFLGILSLPVVLTKAMAEIKVYPDIPEVDSREGLARSLTDAAAFEDSEETSQTQFAVNGFPGYEHRPYEPGDSLKLINWKLSAKRGELYVKRLEGASGSEQTFILDKAGSTLADATECHRAEQLTVEGMLALMMQFAKNELPSRLMIKLGNVWETLPAATPTDVSDIRYRLTDYVFSADAAGRLPSLTDGHLAVFTPRPDSYVVGLVSGYDDRCAAAPNVTMHAENLWTITRDEEDIRFIR